MTKSNHFILVVAIILACLSSSIVVECGSLTDSFVIRAIESAGYGSGVAKLIVAILVILVTRWLTPSFIMFAVDLVEVAYLSWYSTCSPTSPDEHGSGNSVLNLFGMGSSNRKAPPQPSSLQSSQLDQTRS